MLTPEQWWFGQVIASFTAIQLGTIMTHGVIIIITEEIGILVRAVGDPRGRQAGIEASVGEIIVAFTGVMTGDADARGLVGATQFFTLTETVQ